MVTQKKSAKKTAQIRVHSPVMKMTVAAPSNAKRMHKAKAHTNEKSRLVIKCTEDEKMYIKMLAAKEKKTISEYLLSFPRKMMPKSKCDFPGCYGIHKPNKLTEKVIRESERGENLEHHESIEDFWKSMGIDPNAQD